MSISWGYSPKIEKFIPLVGFPADRYLIIVRQAIENLGWDLSHVSASGIIAYTPLSFQSYSEEISVRIVNNFAVVKSECVGIQLLFNDYGKNDANLEKLFHEFDYVQYHLQNEWEQQVQAFHDFAATQDDQYFEKAPLAIKNRIKNVLQLFWPQRGYTVTPILVLLNICFFFSMVFLTFLMGIILRTRIEGFQQMFEVRETLGVLNRELVLEGEYWRLVSYQFLHASTRHLFGNMYALVYIGLIVENKIGWKKFLIVYLASGVFGGLASVAYHQEVSTVGASGAIMGLFGALIALLMLKHFERSATKALLVSTLLVVALMLLNGTSKGVNNICHLGGLIGGFAITYLLTFKYSYVGNERKASIIQYTAAGALVLLVTAAIIRFTPNYQIQEFLKLKDDFNKNMYEFGKIFLLRNDWTKEQKREYVKTNIFVPTNRNLSVVKQMAVLNLNEYYSLDRSLKTKLAHQADSTVRLILKSIEVENQFDDQVVKKVANLQKTQIEFRDSLRKKNNPR